MATPRTLLEMAGVTPVVPRLADLALVLIDFQMEYVDGRLPLPGAVFAIGEAARIVEAARRAGRPIFHVQHRGKPGGLFGPDTSGYPIAAALAPAAAEPVINKAMPNAFAGTDLDARLRAAGAKTLLFAGFMTHMCVSSSVRAAVDLGYAAALVASACGSRDLPDGQGGVVDAATVHRAELAALGDRFAIIAPDADAVLRAGAGAGPA
jgi:nicotinamidase-related amidase